MSYKLYYVKWGINPSPTLPPTLIFSAKRNRSALGPSLFCFKIKPLHCLTL